MADSTFTVRNLGEYSIFMAAPGIVEECNAQIARAHEENSLFLETHPQEMPSMPITGTFLYAHAPNYKGISMVHADRAEWKRRLSGLREFGIDTVILQAALWNELGECYYPSKAFSSMRQFNVAAPMLESAAELGLTVYLGGYGSAAGWRNDLDGSLVDAESSNHLRCLEELFSLYRGMFAGIYFAPETAFEGTRNQSKEQMLNRLYGTFCGKLKEKDSSLKILMSPGTKYFPGRAEEMLQAWDSILKDVPLDILAPQDSVGSCCTLLKDQGPCFRIWKELCDSRGIELWSNVEVFDRKDNVLQLNPSRTASVERIKAQMNHAQKFVRKLISWELLYYTDIPSCGNDAEQLSGFLRGMASRSGSRK